jgi:hypothetical protein
MARQEDGTVMLSAAKHLKAHPDRPFAAAQGDTVRQLRLMRITADLSASHQPSIDSGKSLGWPDFFDQR